MAKYFADAWKKCSSEEQNVAKQKEETNIKVIEHRLWLPWQLY